MFLLFAVFLSVRCFSFFFINGIFQTQKLKKLHKSMFIIKSYEALSVFTNCS